MMINVIFLKISLILLLGLTIYVLRSNYVTYDFYRNSDVTVISGVRD